MYTVLAWRNLWRNSRRTLITVSSIMFAVVFALFLESIERGSHDLLIQNMTRFHTGYIQVQDYRFQDEPSLDNAFYFDDTLHDRILASDENISFTVPRIDAFMLAAGDEATRGSLVLGIDPDREDQLNGLRDRLTEGRFFEPGDGTAVLAEGLASRLNLAVGDSLILLGQGRFGMTAAGMFKIAGLMHHPMRDMNNQMVYLSLPDAQWLLSADEHITSLLVTPRGARFTEPVRQSLRTELSGEDLEVLTWQQLIPELLEALEFDRAGTRLFMFVLYVVIGFGIFGTILTMTLERMKEFGILLSVGMQRFRLALVVFIETFIISILGIITGFILGFLVILYFHFNPIRFTGDAAETMLEFGIDPLLPAAIAPDIFVWQGLVVFLLTTVICFYPTIKIMRLNILEASRK